MFLFCKECGSLVTWEDIHLGHLDRYVYRCENRHCSRSSFHYVEPKSPLPEWVKPEVAKAN